ncbi:hypothetical protein TNCV_3411241 [Trichonephila clavipes]|nr:hypothetical protein TNCV_3411241 [Trichonephila clavipes]
MPFFCEEGFCAIIFVTASHQVTLHQLLHRSFSRQVVNEVAENDPNLALSPTFRCVSFESPLRLVEEDKCSWDRLHQVAVSSPDGGSYRLVVMITCSCLACLQALVP